MSSIFGDIRQLGCVVRDLDDAIAHATQIMGIGPFYVMREIRFDEFSYMGKPSPSPLLSFAFAISGPIQIELIQQHDDQPSAYRDFLADGRSGAQHVSSWTREPGEYDAARESGLRSGARILQEGKMGAIRFVYFDTLDSSLGLSFEIAEGLNPLFADIHQTMITTSQGWDGKDPIRPFA